MMYTKVLAAALLASSLPLLGTAATAAPISQSLTLQPSAATPVENVQFRRHGPFRHRGGWIGPGIALGAGVAIGSALAAPYAYDNYAYDPGYAYVPVPVAPAPRFYRGGNCSQGNEWASGFPAWACSHSDEHRW